MIPNPRRTAICYLMHFESPEGFVRHYAGITSATRLKDRLKEHRHDKRDSKMIALRNQGFILKATDIIPGDAFTLERLFLYEHLCLNACPTCRNAAREQQQA